MNNAVNQLAVLVKISRPAGWLIGPLVFLAGVYQGSSGPAYPPSAWSFPLLFQVFCLSFPLSLYVFGINDLYDYESDRLNPRKRPLDAPWSPDGVIAAPTVQGLIRKSVAAAALLLFMSGLLTGQLINLFYIIVLIVLPYAYCVPPWRFKSRAPLDSFSIGLAAWLAPYALGFSHSGNAWRLPLQTYLITLSVMGIHAFSTVMDYETDLAAGDRTFAVVFGRRAASLFAAAAFALAFPSLRWTGSRLFFILAMAVFLVNALFPGRRLAHRSFQILFAGVLAVCVYWLAGAL